MTPPEGHGFRQCDMRSMSAPSRAAIFAAFRMPLQIDADQGAGAAVMYSATASRDVARRPSRQQETEP